jgi:hypothetical protein
VTTDLATELTRLIKELLSPDVDEDAEDALTVTLVRLSPDPHLLDYLFDPDQSAAFLGEDGTLDIAAVVNRALSSGRG